MNKKNKFQGMRFSYSKDLVAAKKECAVSEYLLKLVPISEIPFAAIGLM